MEYDLGEVVVRFVAPSGVTARQTFQIKRITMMLSVLEKGMVIWSFYRLVTVTIDGRLILIEKHVADPCRSHPVTGFGSYSEPLFAWSALDPLNFLKA